MEFGILGPLRVTSSDGSVALGTPAQRDLLAVLLTAPDTPIAADRLVDELWGDDPPASAHHLLQVYVSRLRRLLGDTPDGPRVVRTGNGYALHVVRGELDAERFGDAVALGRAQSEPDPEAADRTLAGAMALWRGAAFADLPDTLPAVRARAGQLERRRLEAEALWTDVRLRLGRHRELLPDLEDRAGAHPYDEAVHAQRMLALYRSGRQADALEAGRTLQARLRDDLGIDASPAIRDLYRDILLQDPRLAIEPPDPPGNLPTRLTTFIGRERELRAVAAVLDESRLVTLTGPGGIGKTRLAIEVVERLRSRFPGGTWWVDLAPASDRDAVLDVLAGVLGVAAMPGTDLALAVARALGRRKAVLLLDNCEHLAAVVGEVTAAILLATTGPRVLATSRVPLRVEGERLWTVPPLGLPAGEDLPSRAADADAVRLFVDRGRAASPSFVLDAANLDAVVEVCRRLDGISLAIEMAAARLPVLAPVEIARRLDDRFALLELSSVGRITRHRTLDAAFDASYALLSESERRAFERLAVFAGRFDLDAAAAVVAAPDGPPAGDGALRLVTALVAASMLATERSSDATSYRMLETLREYGLARLREHDAEDAARRAHAAHYLGLADRAAGALGTPGFAAWMVRLAGDWTELQAALAWSLDHEPRALTLRAIPALSEFWFRRGAAREAERWTGRMLDGDLAAVPASLRARADHAASFGALLAGDIVEAGRHIDESIAFAKAAGDDRILAEALWARAQIAFAVGDLDGMRQDSLEALAVCDRSGDRLGRARPLTSLASVLTFTGAPATEARDRLEEALPLFRELGDVGGLVLLVLGQLTISAARTGDLEAAERYATEAVELSSGTGWQASALAFYAELLAGQGDLAGADAAASRAVRVALDSGLENWFRIALRDKAVVAAAGERWEDAALLLGASRRNMPAYGAGASISGPIEARGRRALGDARFERLAARGAAMTHDDLADLATPTAP